MNTHTHAHTVGLVTSLLDTCSHCNRLGQINYACGDYMEIVRANECRSWRASQPANQPASWFMPSEMLAVICRPIVYYLATIILNEAYVYMSFWSKCMFFISYGSIWSLVIFTHVLATAHRCVLFIHRIILSLNRLHRTSRSYVAFSLYIVIYASLSTIKFERESFRTKNQMDCRIEMDTYVSIIYSNLNRISFANLYLQITETSEFLSCIR